MYTNRIVSVYGTVTVPYCLGIRHRYGTVLSRYTAPYTVPYYCAQDYGVIQPIYGRKLAVFSSFTVRKRSVNDAVLIDLGLFDLAVGMLKGTIQLDTAIDELAKLQVVVDNTIEQSSHQMMFNEAQRN